MFSLFFSSTGFVRCFHFLPPISLSLSTHLIAELVLGLGELHAKFVCHRDIKPANILLTEAGHLAISDFGLSVVMDPRSFCCKTGEDITKYFGMAGTPGFMGPEVYLKKGHFWSDIFALGVVLFQVANGHPPFEHFFQSQDRCDFKKKSNWGETVNEDFQNLVERMLDLNW